MKISPTITNVFDRNMEVINQIALNRGGTRSSKSHSICQIILHKFLTEENKSFLILRKTLPSLRISTLTMFRKILGLYGISTRVKEDKQTLTYRYKDNLIHFDSMDDPSKKKSTEWNYIWFEEADEFTFNDFKTMKLYLSAKTKKEMNMVYISFNPVDEFSWLKTEVVDSTNYDFEEIVSTYKDNVQNLNKETIEGIERLSEQDENFYRIYALGQWGKLEHLVYNNWEMYNQPFPEFDDYIYGLDFGFNNPSALLKIGFKDKQVCEEELLYESYLTNEMLIERMKKIIPLEDRETKYVFADSSEPDRIEEIRNAGFLVYPMSKEKGSVVKGIDVVKSQGTIKIKGDNLLKEKRSYSWKVDKKTDKIIDDNPVKFNDHLMDAERGALYTYNKEFCGDLGYGGII